LHALMLKLLQNGWES